MKVKTNLKAGKPFIAKAKIDPANVPSQLAAFVREVVKR
jgi:hypothetical protein